MVGYLLDKHKLDPMAQDLNGKVAATYASENGNKDTAQLILKFIDRTRRASWTEQIRSVTSVCARD